MLQNSPLAWTPLPPERTIDHWRACVSNLPTHPLAEADILIAACGRAEYVTGDWVKPGAAVIDVGINAVPDASKKSGYRLVGDVNFSQALQKAGWITPVPGGVGPMTICMLLQVRCQARLLMCHPVWCCPGDMFNTTS